VHPLFSKWQQTVPYTGILYKNCNFQKTKVREQIGKRSRKFVKV